MVAFLVNTIKI